MIHNISLKVWDNKDYLINDKRIQVIEEYVKDNLIRIPFDEDLFQAFYHDTSYELKLDNESLTIYKMYKEGKWLVIEYNGGQ